ncbi:Imm64 family immunity protein [Exiguobacterium sp. s26]|uniref:Imm64 family immunity protein n=1 Tax=Exiguobacterium sp. s26 TaxID=2751231 RepID=UPI001BE934B5
MSDTGGFINIGIVFSKEQSLNQNLYALIDSFVNQGSNLIKLNFSKDKDGTRWIEKQIINNKVTVDLSANYYPFLTLSGDALRIDSDEIKLSPVVEEEFHGFLIDIKWDDLFPLPHNSDIVVSRTNELIRFLIDTWGTVRKMRIYNVKKIQTEKA